MKRLIVLASSVIFVVILVVSCNKKKGTCECCPTQNKADCKSFYGVTSEECAKYNKLFNNKCTHHK